MKQSNWYPIHGFTTPSEYRRLVQYLETCVREGLAIEVRPDPSYRHGEVHGGRWFRDVATQIAWRLVEPDFPFRGLWEPIPPPGDAHENGECGGSR